MYFLFLNSYFLKCSYYTNRISSQILSLSTLDQFHSTSIETIQVYKYKYIYIYIYIVYIHHKKLHFSYKFILELYSFVSVYVCGWVCGCVGGTNMFSKFVICYKSTIKESLKLTKGIK